MYVYGTICRGPDIHTLISGMTEASMIISSNGIFIPVIASGLLTFCIANIKEGETIGLSGTIQNGILLISSVHT